MAHHRPIRLTYVITDLHVGGVPLHLYRLATGLPSDRFDVRVICLAAEGPVGTQLRQAGIPVASCGAKNAGDVRAVLRLKHWLRAFAPDVVHSFLFHANIATRLVAPFAGLPRARLINEIQTIEIERPWHLVVDNLTCRLCRCEVANSEAAVEHLRRQAHVPDSLLCCVYGAVDQDRIREARPAVRSDVGLPDGVPLILWVGRLDPVKGFEEMMEAMARIRQESPAHLLLAGDGAYRPVVQGLIQQHDLSDRVHILGARSDIISLMKMSDVFLLPSRTEGMPNALLEAMAVGLPCVVTDIPACREVIVDGVHGVLAHRGSGPSIARGVQAVISNSMWARQLGEKAAARVRCLFDRDQWLAAWQHRYEDAAQASRPQGRDAGGMRRSL